MKVAVAGKGGAGKTTVSGTIARALARSGEPVLALDADVNPMLGISLGLGPQETERVLAVRQALENGELEHEPTMSGVVERFGVDAPDGVRLVVASRVDGMDASCACCGITPNRVLAEVDDSQRAVVCDLEAGVGTLSRMGADEADVVLVVANPTAKSIEVARRAAEAARGKAKRVIVLANRIRGEDELAEISSVADGGEVIGIPEDPVIARADRDGRAPIDVDASSPAVTALVDLGNRLGA